MQIFNRIIKSSRKNKPMSTYAPIILFCYKRPASTIRTINSLKNNVLAKDSLLYIFSDGPKTEADGPAVTQVRCALQNVTGFKTVRVIESPVNKGLANSVISGVSSVVNEYGKVIVLEDDLVLSTNFLSFMNAALLKYEKDPKVNSISGFGFDMHRARDYGYDVFFTKRHCSWGWAIWKDRWNMIDWEVRDFAQFSRSPAQKEAFGRIGSDLPGMLNKQMAGKIDSWAIRCTYAEFQQQTYTVYPIKSKVINTGFGKDATHTAARFNRYRSTLDDGATFKFRLPESVVDNAGLIREFNRKYSWTRRLFYYALNKLFKG